MSASLVHNEKTAIVTPVIAKKFGSRSTDSRIPSSPTHGEYRIASRQQAVEENIRPSLKSKTESRYIGEDHECFELDAVASFCQEFGIELDGNPWKNFKRLLCGYQDLPFIILQNPTNEHEFEYERMKKCPTLQWLSDVLEEIGLTLEDVVIVDICSLFSDNDLNRMGKDSQRTWDAVEKSYGMVKDILECLNPSMIVSCQCVTLGPRQRMNGRLKRTWEPAQNDLARNLCSSERDMRRGMTKEIHIGSNSTLCVYGVHPRRLKFKGTMIPELRGVFKDVFVPCMDWFRAEKTSLAPTAEGKRSLERGRMVVRTKAGSPSPKRSIEVAVKEVDEETRKLGERISALKL